MSSLIESLSLREFQQTPLGQGFQQLTSKKSANQGKKKWFLHKKSASQKICTTPLLRPPFEIKSVHFI